VEQADALAAIALANLGIIVRDQIRPVGSAQKIGAAGLDQVSDGRVVVGVRRRQGRNALTAWIVVRSVSGFIQATRFR
jgi:hypothetical protein